MLSCHKKDKTEHIETIENIEVNNEIENEPSNFVEESFFAEKTFRNENIYQYNYANGNGTIVNQTYNTNNKIIIRKHEDRFKIYPSTMRPYEINEIIAYNEPFLNSNELFRLKDGDYVTTIQIAFVEYLINNINASSWVKIIDDDNRIGWLDMDEQRDFYNDGVWSIIEALNINNKDWTIRKLTGGVSTNTTLNVRDNPGIIETSILFQLIPQENKHNYVSLSILAVTEETDTIDGITDRWLYIEDDKNRVGWIFGGYTDVERGGPKYRIPASQVRFNFNLP